MSLIIAFIIVALSIGAIIVGPIVVLFLFVIASLWVAWKVTKHYKDSANEQPDPREQPESVRRRFVGGDHLFEEPDR